jgi:hypothetical protein
MNHPASRWRNCTYLLYTIQDTRIAHIIFIDNTQYIYRIHRTCFYRIEQSHTCGSEPLRLTAYIHTYCFTQLYYLMFNNSVASACDLRGRNTSWRKT